MSSLGDVNFWLALAFEKHSHSDQAWKWFDQQEADSCYFCRMTQQGFLRLATNPKAMSRPLTHLQAWNAYEKFIGDERIGFADEPPEIEERWKAYSKGAKYSPKIWNDAYLAAFAFCSSMTLTTFDLGFKKYGKLKVQILK